MATLNTSRVRKSLYDRFMEKFRGFMQKKEATQMMCPICRNDSWDLVGVIAENRALDVAEDKEVALTTVPLVCLNCGFVAEFAARHYDIEETL